MIPYVKYLCISNVKMGLVFPDELPEDYYSPGMFIIEEKEKGYFAAQYGFYAIHRSERLEFDLKRFQNNLFLVNVPEFGVFAFLANQVHWMYNKYVGRHHNMIEHNRLYYLQSLNENKMEKICQEEDFYFVGLPE